MTKFKVSNIHDTALLRGGRVVRIGRRVVSFAPLLGFAVAVTGGIARAAEDDALLNDLGTFAVSECGPASPGAVITCSAPSYPGGITYTGVNGLTLNLANPVMNVANPGVGVAGAAASTGAVSVYATSFAAIGSTANNTSAVRALTSGLGATAVTLESGLVTTTGSGANGALSQVANGNSTASSSVTMNSGIVRTNGPSASGLYAFNQGLGASSVTISNGRIETLSASVSGAEASHGAQARISNAANASAATIRMEGGDIVTAGRSNGILAVTSGSGASSVIIDGGTIRTLGPIANGVASTVLRTDNASMASIVMNGGSVDTAGEQSVALFSTMNGTGLSSVIFNGGTIATHGLAAHAAFSTSAFTARASMTGGSIAISGESSRGLYALVSGTGDATVNMEGGSITTSGTGGSHGIFAQINNRNNSALAGIEMTGGTVATTGNAADGLRAQTNGTGSYSVVLNGGTVTTAGANAAGIQTLGFGSGTVRIGSAAVISSAGGVAIRDGVADADTWGGNVSVTSAGTITGGARLGLGNDQFSLIGGALTGDIYGDDVAVQALDGDDSFNWSGGAFRGSFFGGGGADSAVISAAGYDSTQGLAGGSGPGTDAITFDGVNAAALNGGVSGWERIGLINRSIVGLKGGAEAELGSLDIGAGSLLIASEGLVLGGSVTSAGIIDLSGNGQTGTVFQVGGGFDGGGAAVLDVALGEASLLSSDRLVIGGDVTGTTALVMKNSTPGLGAATTGDGILVAEVGGTAAANSFVLASGPLASGAFIYDLDFGGQADANNNFYLVSRTSPDGAAVQAAPYLIASSFVDLPGLLTRRAGRMVVGGEPGGDGSAAEQGTRHGPLGPWAQMGGAQDRIEAGNANSYKTNRWSLKAGYDADAGIPWPGSLIASGYVTYASADSSIDSHYGSESMQSDAVGAGATLTYYAPRGSYVDLQGLVMAVNSDLASASGVVSAAAAASAEIGHVIAVGSATSLIPSAQLQYGGVSASSFTYGAENEVTGFGEDGFTGRMGLALQSTLSGDDQRGPVLTASLDYIRDFSSGIGVRVNGYDVATDVPENWLEAGLGLDWQLGDASLIHLRAGYATALGEKMADNTSLNALASFHFAF